MRKIFLGSCLLAAGIAAATACGSSSDDGKKGTGGTHTGGTAGDASAGTSGTGASGGLAGIGGTAAAGGTAGVGGAAGSGGTTACGDTQTDPKNCGSCGNACAAGQSCVQGACVCPPYQSLCNGTCISTTADPANCGGCGVTCPGGQVCSANGCATGCLAGLTACNGACVDLDSDNKNCGACGSACGSGQGCSAGKCVTAVAVGPGPATCAGGGPQKLDPSQSKCSGGTAATTFDWGICSCKDVSITSKLLIDGYDSTKGPYQPGQLGGGIGLNGVYSASSEVDIWGTLWASATGGLDTGSTTAIHNEVRAGGPLSSLKCDVTSDGYANGNVSGGPLAIGKTLTIPAGATVSGQVSYGALVHAPVSVPPPCACGAGQILPVAAWVTNAKTQNDNAAIGLDPAVFTKATQPARLDLPCGRYYLDAIDATGDVAIVAHGETILYIGGDVKSGSFLTITLDPTAELDIVIGGTIVTGAKLKIGSANYPALCRTYVAGSSQLTITSDTVLATNLYAANAKVVWTSNLDMFGAVFAGDFMSTSDTAIHYDREVVKMGDKCPPPPPPPPPADGGPLDGGSSCGSCMDCGNQACINGACGACGSSADCCPPLVCVAGTCEQPIIIK